jgi:hypothetical protein
MSSTRAPISDDMNLLDVKLMKRLFQLYIEEQRAIKEYRSLVKKQEAR